MEFLLAIVMVMVSGLVGMIMDMHFKVENKTVYWALGIIPGLLTGGVL